MVELLSDQFAESGMVIGEITVDASSSWTQFFKNIPMALIIYILVCGGIFTKEYQSGTLVLMLAKGLRRSQAVIAKATVLLLGWTLGYFICFGITFGYNAYFWGNSIVNNLTASILAWWLFGIFSITLTVFFSALSDSTLGVMLGTIACIALSYVLSLMPKIAPYTPTSLMSVKDGNIVKAVIVTSVLSLLFLFSSIPLMNKKAL